MPSVLLISLQDNLDVLGLKSLHHHLRGKGIDSVLLHLPYYDAEDNHFNQNIIDFVKNGGFSFIGFSLMYSEYHKSKVLTKKLKENGISSPIIWGGIHPMMEPLMCLEYADFVCIGEGEGTVVDIASALSEGKDIRGVNNLAYLEGETLIENPLYPPLTDLDEIPVIEHIPKNAFIQETDGIIGELDAISFRKNARYSGTVHDIIMTRGCPFQCTYCCNNFLAKLYPTPRLRRRSIKNVIHQLEKAKKENPYIEFINFQDDCFLSETEENLKDFCKIYSERVGLPFVIRAIPTYVTDKKIQMMKEAGLSWINMGLQSGSDRILKGVYKRVSFKEDFLKAARIVKRYSVAGYYDVILDNPFETEEDNLETADALIECPRPFYPQFYSLICYPGTEIHKKLLIEKPGYDKLELDKDFFIYSKTDMNKMIKMVALLPATFSRILLRAYQKNPNGIVFKSLLISGKVSSSILFEPLTYLRVILLSFGGSYSRLFRIGPYYLKDTIVRYKKQYKRYVPKSTI